MPAPITSPASIPTPEPPSFEARPRSGGFQEAFASAVSSVEASGQHAATSVEQFLSGESGELHTAILATQRAELSFDLFLQMRNKVVSAYQEIMRMQV